MWLLIHAVTHFNIYLNHRGNNRWMSEHIPQNGMDMIIIHSVDSMLVGGGGECICPIDN